MADFDFKNAIDISVPLHFDGPQPNAYGVEPASAKACEYGELVGDTRRNGSCNFESIIFIPHCNGTHTECVGHITNERISVLDCLQDVMMGALLVSVAPQKKNEINDSYAVAFGENDPLITLHALKKSGVQPPATAGGSDALIVRTLPNDDSKLERQYGKNNIPPYFTTEAIQFIVECGFKHLLVDMPSIDRLFDQGKLSNHRIFWNVEPGSFELNPQSRLNSTITELIYVPNDIADGEYLLNLQIAPFMADASPSRPILFNRMFDGGL